MSQADVKECDKPLIQLFKNPLGYYMYDTNVNQIIKIDEDEYIYLKDKLSGKDATCSENVLNHINLLKENFFLSDNRIQKILNPQNEFVSGIIHNNMGQLILQVTRNCNLQCAYCNYVGETDMKVRKHSNERMSFETAKKAIDLYYDSSKSSKTISIGFYGGEPLLEIDLIKKCVEYAEDIFAGKNVIFSMTTNGTLLTKERVQFLSENNFNVMVSIDGDREAHNKNRKFRSGDGSFDTIIENINMVKREFPFYFQSKIHYNTVMDQENDFNCMDSFFSKNPLFSATGVMSTFIDDRQLVKKTVSNATFIESFNYEVFKLFLSLFGRYPKEKVSFLVRSYMNSIEWIDRSYIKDYQLPKVMHHSGPCLPVKVKLLVTTNGQFFPCEKCNEMNNDFNIGNLDDGFNEVKIKKLINVGNLSEENCKKCWLIRYCSICGIVLDDGEETSKSKKYKLCNKMQDSISSAINQYIVLKHYGYDRDIATH